MKKFKLLVLVCIFSVLCSACSKSDDVQTVTDNSQLSEEITVVGEIITDNLSTTVKTEDTTVNSIYKPTKEDNKNSEQSDNVENTFASVVQNSEISQNPVGLKVTLSVNCKNAIDYGILNVGTFASVLSPDGQILPETEVEISEGESAFKVIKRTLKANKITYSIDSGGYIKKINGLSEFDCGQQSGWMYKVNGVTPSVSCKNYILKNGDKIELIYTCNLGNDI